VRAELAVLLVAVIQRRRATGHLHAVHRVGVSSTQRCRHRAHRCPVGIQFLGEHHRQPGLAALAHVDPVALHGDRAVSLD